MENEKKLEFANTVIGLFEGILDNEGIVIPNEERDGSLDPDEASNIYGDDYYGLEDYVLGTMDNWGAEFLYLVQDDPFVLSAAGIADRAEFVGQIIDGFEGFLTDKGIAAHDRAFLDGARYDTLSDGIIQTMEKLDMYLPEKDRGREG